MLGLSIDFINFCTYLLPIFPNPYKLFLLFHSSFAEHSRAASKSLLLPPLSWEIMGGPSIPVQFGKPGIQKADLINAT